MSRYFPPIGTAGFDRECVKGKSRVPRPPPRIIASTSRMGGRISGNRGPLQGRRPNCFPIRRAFVICSLHQRASVDCHGSRGSSVPGHAVALTMSVIVCAYNEGCYIQRCLESLLSQSRPPDDILVVNNASTDDTAA